MRCHCKLLWVLEKCTTIIIKQFKYNIDASYTTTTTAIGIRIIINALCALRTKKSITNISICGKNYKHILRLRHKDVLVKACGRTFYLISHRLAHVSLIVQYISMRVFNIHNIHTYIYLGKYRRYSIGLIERKWLICAL